MVDHLPFHELLLFMLFWLCLTSYRAWHRHRPATCQTPPTSANQVQPGFSDRKPFPGLIHKPRCAAWEQPQQQIPQVPPASGMKLSATKSNSGEQRGTLFQPALRLGFVVFNPSHLDPNLQLVVHAAEDGSL
jgi:hypothetical protein